MIWGDTFPPIFGSTPNWSPICWGHGIPAMLAQQLGRLEMKSKSSLGQFDEVPFGSKFNERRDRWCCFVASPISHMFENWKLWIYVNISFRFLNCSCLWLIWRYGSICSICATYFNLWGEEWLMGLHCHVRDRQKFLEILLVLVHPRVRQPDIICWYILIYWMYWTALSGQKDSMKPCILIAKDT